MLAVPAGQRKPTVANFDRVPYLNSSLFEITELENEVLRVNSLRDQLLLPLAARSVLGTRPDLVGTLQPLHYLFAVLDAYDFTSEGKAKIQEENKRLINASVLGLIFEKINGYRDGSFYTPGFSTEHMCRETIRRAVVQRFRADTDHFAAFDSDRFADLRPAANRLVNGMTRGSLPSSCPINSCEPASAGPLRRYIPQYRDRYGELSQEQAFEKLNEEYPAIATWLIDYEAPAMKRYDQGDYWWELRACDYYEAFEQPKIFYQEIMTYQSFTYDEASLYSNNKLFIIPNANFGLLGLLNSKVIWLYLKSTATSYNGGALGMQSPFVLALPVPIDFHEDNRIGGVVQEILLQKQANPATDTTALGDGIDLLVYRLYGLSYAEVLLVDETFALSETDYDQLPSPS